MPNDANKPNPSLGEQLTRKFMGCLLFKLGGEMTLTVQEMDDISKYVGGVQIIMKGEDGFILRTRTPESIIRDQDKIKAL